jgi:hypothetical protein
MSNLSPILQTTSSKVSDGHYLNSAVGNSNVMNSRSIQLIYVHVRTRIRISLYNLIALLKQDSVKVLPGQIFIIWNLI